MSKNVYIPPSVVHDFILPYLDIKSVATFTCVNQEYSDVAKKYFKRYGWRNIEKWVLHRKIDKQRFFKEKISNIPYSQLNHYGFARTFCILDDSYHDTDFTERVFLDQTTVDDLTVAKRNPLCCQRIRLYNPVVDWTITHSSFYEACLQEIHLVYDDIYEKLKKKYNLILK
jgi:hypothetical protein